MATLSRRTRPRHAQPGRLAHRRGALLAALAAGLVAPVVATVPVQAVAQGGLQVAAPELHDDLVWVPGPTGPQKAGATVYQPPRYADSDPAGADLRLTLVDVPEEARPAIALAEAQLERALVSPVPVRGTVTWVDDSFFARGGPMMGWFPGQDATPLALLDAETGRDAHPGTDDLALEISSRPSWYYGTDGKVPRGRADLTSVVLHELLHGFGFSGRVQYAGGAGTHGTPPARFDRHVAQDGTLPIVEMDGQRLGSALTSEALRWDGSRAAAARGGPVPLFSPYVFQPGSSLYHFDEAAFDGQQGAVMTPVLVGSEALHDVGDVTLGVLADMGWTVRTGSGAAPTPPGPAPAPAPPAPPPLTPKPVEAPVARDTARACPSSVPEDGYRDLPDGAAHEQAVDCVTWWGVSAGRGDGTYGPTEGVRRGQMATFLARVLRASDRAGDLPAAPAADRFRDVAPGGTHAASIALLGELGIVGGRRDGTYGPDDLVTRDQMATFLVRTLRWVAQEDLGAGAPDRFADDDGNTHEAMVDAAAALGVATGTSTPGAYAPGAPVRRDQMGSFLARSLAVLVDEGVLAPRA